MHIVALHAIRSRKKYLCAHDGCKGKLTEWAIFNRGTLAKCEIVATGTTGALVAEATGLDVDLLPITTRSRTTSMSKRCCVSRCSTTCRSHAIEPQLTS